MSTSQNKLFPAPSLNM